jgi:7-carboxy-7-deazaguanine synthase
MGTGKPMIQLNELYDRVTIQGEGLDAGKPCWFIRTHGCPVQCPGCDTHFTWDGSETGHRSEIDTVAGYIDRALVAAPGAGFVLSGGEPLLHYRNTYLQALVESTRRRTWISLETSGCVGLKPLDDHDGIARRFLRSFSTVHLSPKVTPCLKGNYPDDILLANVPAFLAAFAGEPTRLALKMVVRDEADVDRVVAVDQVYGIRRLGFTVFLMPYGVHREEILETSERLIPYLAQTGYVLSMRLHSILWGKTRGV